MNRLPRGAPPSIRAPYRVPPAQPAAGSVLPSAALVPPFWQLKPPSGVDLATGNLTGTLAAGAGSTLTLTPASAFQVLDGYKGVLSALQVTVQAPTTLLNISFILLNQQAPVPGWTYQPLPVAANSVTQDFTGPLQIGPRSTLTVLVRNNAASGPWDVVVSLFGWQWSIFDETRTFGSA